MGIRLSNGCPSYLTQSNKHILQESDTGSCIFFIFSANVLFIFFNLTALVNSNTASLTLTRLFYGVFIRPMNACVRLQNELQIINKTRPYGFYARPSKRNIYQWNCQIHSNGYFYQLTLKFPRSYPLDPPLAVFSHQVYHPNIYSNNTVCIDLLGDKWSPSITIKDILAALARLLDQPNPESPANVDAANEYLRNPNSYKMKFKECSDKYHKSYTFLSE